MNYLADENEIEKIAEELGLQVKFNSDTPGVLNTATGELKQLSSYFKEYFSEMNIIEED